ncbi:CDP-glucose 4,6-dehydratase [Bradyrhizobium prioriisuperbiae]|uniref:CDP-glucose 4,6-dehydratase n=1 Tax=Bradyrhizobium prioriisuperbiae TaxID=2854389 RepID=UPI0028EBCD99|nr:CDP-glucose 4,6-dehydratase [Bradyrhizobium prioritasuperba]
MFGDIYKGRRVLVTGHSGFKGSWLVLWLQQLGAEVTGLSLVPNTQPNHWTLLGTNIDSVFLDIRDPQRVMAAIGEAKPEIIFHLAAQPLVRRSYREPTETWHTNVVGTANLLNACRFTECLKAVVVVTTDKCYANIEADYAYQESDRLGGYDPYSASKAGAELVVDSFRQSFFSERGPLIASARAGNVIGGGDWSEDRLIPDLSRAMENDGVLEIRSPRSTRPWQHVLECLSGYLLLGSRLLSGQRQFAEAWNFGPGRDGNRTVEEVLTTLRLSWPKLSWEVRAGDHPHEAKLLQLDCSKANSVLEWWPVWTFETAVEKTAEWYCAWSEDRTVLSVKQLEDYIASGRAKGSTWTRC